MLGTSVKVERKNSPGDTPDAIHWHRCDEANAISRTVAIVALARFLRQHHSKALVRVQVQFKALAVRVASDFLLAGTDAFLQKAVSA